MKTALSELEEIAERALDAFNDKHDLNTTVALLSDGIARGRAMARQNSADASQILGVVKGMAYNLASFTWPGWNEVTVSREQMAIGREAAQLNYDLAIQLNRPPDKVAMAHWLLGAHHLAATDFDKAIEQFTQGRVKEIDDANRYLADGYIAITHLAAGRDDKDGFEEAITALTALKTDDANFFADQLKTARQVFVEK